MASINKLELELVRSRTREQSDSYEGNYTYGQFSQAPLLKMVANLLDADLTRGMFSSHLLSTV